VEYCPSDIYSTEYLLERHHHRRSDQANSCVQDLKYCSGLKDLKSKACMGIEASKTMVEKVRAGLDQQKTPTSHLAGIVEKEVRLAHGVCWQTAAAPTETGCASRASCTKPPSTQEQNSAQS